MVLWKRKKKSDKEQIPSGQIIDNSQDKQLTHDLVHNIDTLTNVFQKDTDFSSRTFHIVGETPAAAFYISSLVDKEKINRDIIHPLQETNSRADRTTLLGKKNLLLSLLYDVLYYSDGEIVSGYDEILDAILHGKTVVLVDGYHDALILDTFTLEKRGITEPESERVVRGPREGFIEVLQTNISLLRYRLPVPEFRAESIEIGEKTKTKVAVCYLDNIADDDLVLEVKKRINDINVDRILDAGYIEQFIQDNPRSPFPQVQNTERPDRAVGNILEGRVVILVDGSPFALIVPAVFNQFYQTSEDYLSRFIMSSIIRFIRFVALLFSLTFSSLYITVLSFHPEMIPAQFMVAASSGRAGVPFPVVVEVLLMEIAMEILREATIRMPQQVGGALSIVGVLVIGQAAVSAGFVSPITVVIIALSTIGSFATPSYNAAIAFRMLKFPLIILSGIIGLLGLAIGLMFIVNHMLSLRSFGVPYFTPLSPWNKEGVKDSFIRAPLRWFKERPSELHPKDRIRVESSVKEGPTNPLANRKRGKS
ncbi:spore germination protein [Ornithinibacillus scapharcae]|uniref:spore germination protein n=1 Tax=Ornithinibacillus scapharcae TaxID=1147159 RepID=UPI000225BD07|nr:spore germination protein [Ornithinibacillus scapharcae]